MTAIWLKGLLLGLSAGILPGPMLGLVIRETLAHGRRAGRLAACAPLLTDAPIIALALLIVGTLPPAIAQALGIGGGLFVIWMGIDALRSAAAPQAESGPLGSLGRAILTNLLNPHPWLFWLPVGGPLLTSAWAETGLAGVAGFLAAFYLMLVGSKVVLADIVAHSRRFLDSTRYRRLIQASGLLLIALGAVLLFEYIF